VVGRPVRRAGLPSLRTLASGEIFPIALITTDERFGRPAVVRRKTERSGWARGIAEKVTAPLLQTDAGAICVRRDIVERPHSRAPTSSPATTTGANAVDRAAPRGQITVACRGVDYARTALGQSHRVDVTDQGEPGRNDLSGGNLRANVNRPGSRPPRRLAASQVLDPQRSTACLRGTRS